MSKASSRVLEKVARLCLALLALSLPYEAVLFRAGPLQTSNLEILLALVLLSTAALVVFQKRWQQADWLRFPRSWLALWALTALALLLSTLLAPEYRLNAAKASTRVLSGMALAICVPQILRRRGEILWVVVPLLLGGLPAVIGGLWEVSRSASLNALDPFRAAPTTAGPFVRLTGSFDHANQAAMFLEATLPLLLALLVVLYRRQLLAALGVALVTFLWLQAVIATYSRTALVAIVASAAFVAALSWFRRRRAGLVVRNIVSLRGGDRDVADDGSGPEAPRETLRALPWASLALAVMALLALNALFDPVVRMRFRTEGDNEWYNLSFDAPPTLTVDAGHTVTTTITVHNEGDLTWSSTPPNVINLGGHWHLPDQDYSLAYTPRWSLPHTVSPGEAVTMQVGLQAPMQEGTYQFRWDLIHEGVIWFSYKNGVRTCTLVTVNEAATTPPQQEPETVLALNSVVEAPPDLAPIPDRRTLWRIAAQELAKHPLLGIGTDNFRLVYGRALDYEQWNETIHTNSWYVETLVSMGLLGALPFFAWMAVASLGITLRLLRPGATVWHAALAAGLFAFFIHGVLDYFLSANATGLLFWLLSGLWVVVDTKSSGGV